MAAEPAYKAAQQHENDEHAAAIADYKQSIRTKAGRKKKAKQAAAAKRNKRQAAATERGREVTRRFLGEGTPYTPQPVNFYNR